MVPRCCIERHAEPDRDPRVMLLETNLDHQLDESLLVAETIE